MKKSILIIVLITALLLSVLGGCGSGGSGSSGAASVSEAAVSVSEPEAIPETVEVSEPAEEPASVAEPVSAEEPETQEPAVTVEYPIFEEPTTLSIYWCFNNFLSMFNITQDAVYENPTFRQWQDATNVKLDFEMIGESVYGTQLSLVFAAGDYYDFYFGGERYYTAGADAAVDEEVLLDIAPLLEEHAPDYNAILNKYPDFRVELTSSEGYIVSFAEYCEYSESGAAIRKDWLDQVGMDIPATMDEVWDVAKAWKEELGVRDPVLWNADLTYFFGWNSFGVANPLDNDVPWQIDTDGKTVVSSLTLPGFKECLQWMHDAFQEGLITDDFLGLLNMTFDEYVYANETGLVYTNANLLAGGGADRSGQPSFEMRAIPDPMKEKGMENGLAKTYGGVGASSVAVSALTEYPEKCVEFMNWLYTPEGILVSDFGEEGEGFYYDENGVPQYTDLVLHNPDGMPTFVAAFVYTSFVGVPYFNTTERRKATFTTEAELECIDVWNTGRTGMNIFHGKNTLEESQRYSQIAGDIVTAVTEQNLRFVTGERSLEEYDDYIADLERMGLGDLGEIRQAAYDRYLEG